MKFEVSATFGEGAIVALVDPETKAILKPLYDAESTSGHLKFSDGEETTVVWTRMSGADGALMGEAILSDGEVLALTDRASGPRDRKSLVRPVRCGSIKLGPWNLCLGRISLASPTPAGQAAGHGARSHENARRRLPPLGWSRF